MSKLSPIKCIRGKSFSGTVSVLLLFWNHGLKERAQPHWVILEARKRKEVIRFWSWNILFILHAESTQAPKPTKVSQI